MTGRKQSKQWRVLPLDGTYNGPKGAEQTRICKVSIQVCGHKMRVEYRQCFWKDILSCLGAPPMIVHLVPVFLEIIHGGQLQGNPTYKDWYGGERLLTLNKVNHPVPCHIRLLAPVRTP